MPVSPGDAGLRLGARRILDTLARHYPARLTLSQIGVLAKLKTSSGTFNTHMSTLRRNGFITVTGEGVQATEWIAVGGPKPPTR